MDRCFILCAAGFDGFLDAPGAGDFVLAADGGYAHCKAAGIIPDEVLGDFDSLHYIPEDARVFPVEKDDTDSMLAVRRGLQLGYREFLLYGSLDGTRLDHTVANFQTLQFLADRGAVGYLIGRDYIVTVLKEDTLRFPVESTGILSVFCMGSDARGVTLRGLKYPLEEGTLTAGFPLGVSNHFTDTEASVSVKEGSLLLLWDRKNGLPLR